VQQDEQRNEKCRDEIRREMREYFRGQIGA
jgi:hypothetical protein